ncbi:MAG: glycosyltransferase [Chitinivibrionales bacterium]|nr:glycosyltransferase [Chitinivibrionales bacterium]
MPAFFFGGGMKVIFFNAKTFLTNELANALRKRDDIQLVVVETPEFYLAHDDERNHIAQAGTAKILRQHTYDIRLDQLFERYKEVWGI